MKQYGEISRLLTQGEQRQAFEVAWPLALSGDTYAQGMVGVLLLHWQGKAPKDKNQALYWLNRAATNGNAMAQRTLGDLYYKGTQVPQSDEKAAYWIRKAALRGAPFAQNELGILCERGQGVERDLVEADKWYRLAAKGRSTYAPRHLQSLEASLNEDEIAEAKRRAASFKSR